MHIVLMANHFNTGGITSYILNLGQGLVQKGHQVTVVSGAGNCVELLRSKGIRHVCMDIRVKSEVHPKLWVAMPEFLRLLKEEKVDILHANTRVTQVISALAARVTGKPFVSTCHGFFRPHLFRRLFPCWGNGVIAVSRGVEQHLINDFKLDPSIVRLVPNGIDAGQFKSGPEERMARRSQWRVEGDPVVGIIARLSDVKGIDVLINAFPEVLAAFPQAQLWIVGEGPERMSLEKMVEVKGLSMRVRFEPEVNRTANILPILDVFVMPSLQEGLGLSVMEAQAAGIPVVVSEVGGLPDLVIEGKTGLLAPPGDSETLARKIIQMLKDPRQARSMAAAAREQVVNYFSLEQMVEGTLGIYEENIGR